MKIIATGDLHYGLKTAGDRSTEELAEKVNKSDAHVFIIAGDISKGPENLEKCLVLFEQFKGHKMLVAGNHDIWSTNGSSLHIYRDTLKKLVKKHGFHYLDDSPFILDKTGFAGTIGWYDYSFRLKDLNIPMEYYEKKYFPRVASWNDRKYVKWDYSDIEFLDYILNKLKSHIDSITEKVEKIVCVTHHLPFKSMTLKTGHPPWDFAQAYLGSEKIGELYMDYEKIKVAICAHSHRETYTQKGHVKCFNIGSTYMDKKLLTIEV